MEKVNPGKYYGVITNYGIFESKAGNLSVFIDVKFEATTDAELVAKKIVELRWFGSLSEKAAPYTLKTLIKLGYKGKNILTLADGPMSKLIEPMKKVSIIVEDKINPKLNTIESKIAFINDVSSKFNNQNPNVTQNVGWINDLAEKLRAEKITTSLDEVKKDDTNLEDIPF
jgi:hypothetical protein